jgi:hypothetical protein
MNSEAALSDTSSGLTRKQKFELWKLQSGPTPSERVTSVELAKKCGVAVSVFSEMISSEVMPAWHHQTLLAAGVPANCLPLPVVHKKGPKPEGFEYQEPEDTEEGRPCLT